MKIYKKNECKIYTVKYTEEKVHLRKKQQQMLIRL
jgi:hypothetical protein